MINEIRTILLNNEFYWKLFPRVNILSGVNGIGKSFLLKEISSKHNAILINTFFSL